MTSSSLFLGESSRRLGSMVREWRGASIAANLFAIAVVLLCLVTTGYHSSIKNTIMPCRSVNAIQVLSLLLLLCGSSQGYPVTAKAEHVVVSNQSSLLIPLQWAVPEQRLVFNVSILMSGPMPSWAHSTSRVDLGSGVSSPYTAPVSGASPPCPLSLSSEQSLQVGLMLPSIDCKDKSGRCANPGCECAPSASLLMPATCPGGGKPSSWWLPC